MSDLKPSIDNKLSELIQVISDEYLIGRPQLLCVCLYENIKNEIIRNIEEVEKTFARKEKSNE